MTTKESLGKVCNTICMIYENLEDFPFSEFGAIIFELMRMWCNDNDIDLSWFIDSLKSIIASEKEKSTTDKPFQEECAKDHINRIRNSKGSFVCETFYDDGIWVVAIKKKAVYSYILLYKNGSFSIVNKDDGEPINSILHTKSTA